jgi:dTDP-L-rhamnose 4-epimerase
MKLLITGGLGFIGRACIPRFLARDCSEIRILDNLEPTVHGPDPDITAYRADWDERVHVTRGSVTDRAVLGKLLEDVDAVLHLAALTSVPGSMQDSAWYCDVNVTGTANLVDLLGPNDSVRKLTLVSSRAVYGEGPYRCTADCTPLEYRRVSRRVEEWVPRCPACGGTAEPLPATETAALEPLSVYGMTKLYQEQLFTTSRSFAPATLTILRLQNVYGVGLNRVTPDVGVANILAAQALQKRTLRLFEDGNPTRDFVYIDDVADLLVTATIDGLSNDPIGIYNVGSGTPTTLRELAGEIFTAAGLPAKIEISGDYRIGDVRYCVADTSRLSAAYDWSPVPLKDGIVRMVDWLRD